MKQSINLHPKAGDIFVVLAVILLAVAVWFGIWKQGAGDDKLSAVISIDGVETERIVLGEPEQRTYAGNGYTMHVTLSDQGVAVEMSDCPTQDCVHTGTITRAGQSVVCLPARIIIELEGTTTEGDIPDLVIG